MSLKKINILPEFIANKIAAGEVVQRPESVVKELLENALDAKAKSIEVFIRRAGKVLIQVVDDGEGMNADDALLSIQRHATSKIKDVDDLEKINTFGFRGEALSSISAVSQLEIKTETAEDEIGTLIKVENDEVTVEKGSFSKGTSISVKNLFYNTPARRNFLKSNSTELKHIIEAFKRAALSYPEVSFKFTNDDDLIFDFSAGSQNDRIKAVFADNIFDVVLHVEELSDYLNVSGYVAKPTFLKKSKDDQYLFINRRYVRSKLINHAVFSAYENILEKGDYPFFLIFIEIDPKKFDINVHPQKLEVKFDDDKNIYSYVNAVIKKGLGSYDLVPNISFGRDDKKGVKLNQHHHTFTEKQDFSDRPAYSSGIGSAPRTNRSLFSNDDIDRLFDTFENKPSAAQRNINIENQNQSEDSQQSNIEFKHSEIREGTDSTFIVALHNKYILAQIKTGLMVIDAHVAHERILYEKALKSFTAELPFSQQLLFAQSQQVDVADYGLLQELEQHLSQLGFALKFFSGNTVVIEGVPSDVKVGTETETLLDILSEYRKNQREKSLDVTHNVAASFSCKAAIKAGDKLTEKEMRLLVDQLFATSMPYVCPHGRPIVIKISLEEFDKRFGRT